MDLKWRQYPFVYRLFTYFPRSDSPSNLRTFASTYTLACTLQESTITRQLTQAKSAISSNPRKYPPSICIQAYQSRVGDIQELRRMQKFQGKTSPRLAYQVFTHMLYRRAVGQIPKYRTDLAFDASVWSLFVSV